MSHEPLTYVDLQDPGNAQSLLVLHAIARHADWDTGICYPSVRTIARMAKCSEKTARRHLAKLREDGFIALTPRLREDGGTAAQEIELVGYRNWIECNRKGGTVQKPRKSRRYDDRSLGHDNDAPLGQVDQPPIGQNDQDPPGQNDQYPPGQHDQPPLVKMSGPPGHLLTSPPGQQVSSHKELSLEQSFEQNAREGARSEGLIFDLEGKGVRERLRQRFGEEVFGSWFAGVAFARSDRIAIAAAPSKFVAKWLGEHFEPALLAACQAEWPDVERVKIVFRSENPKGAAA